MQRGTTTSGRVADRRSRSAGSHRRPPSVVRRPGLYLGVASAGAVLVNVVLFGGEPVAQAEAEPVSVAAQLGLTAEAGALDPTEDLAPLEDLAASRSERDAAQSAAQKSQAAADRAELERQKAAAAKKARAEAEAKAKAAAAAEAAEEEQAAEEEAAAPAAASTAVSAIAQISNTAGPIQAAAQAAANAVVSNVPCASGIHLGGTRPSAADPGGHPSGLAVDYMVGSDSACGDAIVEYHIANWDALGVDYIIWQQRYLGSPGGGWSYMEDRGSGTANHMDHPHVNYRG